MIFEFSSVFYNSSNFEQRFFIEKFLSGFEQFWGVRAKHFRVEISENCSEMID